MKKRLIVVLLTVIMTIPLVMVFPRANTTQTSSNTVTSYGNYTFKQGTSDTNFDFELPFGLEGGSFPINVTFNTGSWMSLDYTFKDKYSGTMKFSVTSSADWVLQSSNVYWYASADGVESTCYISATTSMSSVSRVKTFSVIFTNATSIHFGVVAANNLNFFNSSQSIAISNASFTSQPDMGDIYTDLHQLRTWWDLYVPGMSTNLSNIASDISNIKTNITTLLSYVDGVEGGLTNITNAINALVPYLDGVEGGLYALQSSINRLNYPLNSLIFVWNQAYESYGNGNIFNITDPNIYLYKSDFDNITIKRVDTRFTTTDIINGNYLVLKYFFRMSGNTTADNYYNFPNLRFQWRDINGNLNNTEIFTSDSLSWTKFIEFNTTRNTYILTIYVPSSLFFVSNNITYNYDFAIDNFTLDNVTAMGFMFGGMVDTLPYDTQYLNLLNSINNGIGALNDDYDTSEYDQLEHVVDNLNDNLLVDVNNSKDSILTDISNQSGIGSGLNLNNVRTAVNGFYNDLTTIFPSIKYLIIFGLIILVLGVMF